MHLSEAQLKSLRAMLSDLGRKVNDAFIATQAGKPMPAGVAIPVTIDPREPTDVRLKQFLLLINAKMKLIRDGNASYGTCSLCNQPIAYADLEYEPWCDVHPACAAAAADS